MIMDSTVITGIMVKRPSFVFSGRITGVCDPDSVVRTKEFAGGERQIILESATSSPGILEERRWSPPHPAPFDLLSFMEH